MFKVTSKDKSLLLAVVNAAVTFGVMLAMIKLLGELHGLISTVVLLIVQTSFLTGRVVALERERRLSREPSEGERSKIIEKTA
jgi:uncharacterized protein involved in response to NO